MMIQLQQRETNDSLVRNGQSYILYVYIVYKIYQMSDKSLQKLQTKFLQRKNNSSQKLIRIEKQSSYKQLPVERVPRKRDAWSHGQKNKVKKTQSSQIRPLKTVKLDPLQPRSSFKIMQPLEKMTNLSKKYEQKNEFQQIQNEIINKKVRFITAAFERNESDYEKKIKKYFSNFLAKNSQKDLIIAEQVNSTMNRVNYFWWNVLATLFGSIKFALTNNNISLSQNLALAYFLMEEQLLQSEAQLIKQFQDPNHIVILSQCLYFQRLLCFYIADPNQCFINQKSQIGLLLDIIGKLSLIRSLILQILNETQQSFLKFNKLKKPSYLIRQKKLIQINKIITQLRQNSNKLMKISLITKFFIFDNRSVKCYLDLLESANVLKEKMLSIPRAPFLKLNDDSNYTIVCDPQGLLYSQDKKNSCLVIKSYTQDILKQLSQMARIVLFSKKKMKSIEPFLLQTNYVQFTGILDKQYETYKEGKKIKDLKKIGCLPQKMLVLDTKYQKYYQFYPNNCIPVIKEPNQSYFNFIITKLKSFIKQAKIVDQQTPKYFTYNQLSTDLLKK